MFKRTLSAAVAAAALSGPAMAAAEINASVLPNVRTTAFGGDPPSIFAAIANAGDATAFGCSISIDPDQFTVDATLLYQTTNSSNMLIGTPNTPVDIPAGTVQNFYLEFTPTAPFAGRQIFLSYSCDGGATNAQQIEGTNSVYLEVGGLSSPDIIPIVVTATGDGIVTVPSLGGVAAMSAAATNIGGPGPGGFNSITVRPSFPGLTPTVSATICETNASAECLAPPTPSVVATIDSGASTFSVFVDVDDSFGVPLFPAELRLALDFEDSTGALRGRSSAALSAPGPVVGPNDTPEGVYEVAVTLDEDRIEFEDLLVSAIVIGPGGRVFGLESYPDNYVTFLAGDPFSFDASASPAPTISGVLNVTLHDEVSGEESFDVGVSGDWSTNNRLFTAFSGQSGLLGPVSGTFTGVASDLYFNAYALGDLAAEYGVWELSGVASGDRIGTVTVAADGTFSGLITISDNGSGIEQCTLTGTIAIVEGGKNFLDQEFALSGCSFADSWVGHGLRATWFGDGSEAPIENAIYLIGRAGAGTGAGLAIALVIPES